jgi:hypothetical protein
VTNSADASGSIWQTYVLVRLQRFKDVCELFKDDLFSRCCATPWNEENVRQVQEVVCSVVADGRGDCRKGQNFGW